MIDNIILSNFIKIFFLHSNIKFLVKYLLSHNIQNYKVVLFSEIFE